MTRPLDQGIVSLSRLREGLCTSLGHIMDSGDRGEGNLAPPPNTIVISFTAHTLFRVPYSKCTLWVTVCFGLYGRAKIMHLAKLNKAPTRQQKTTKENHCQ